MQADLDRGADSAVDSASAGPPPWRVCLGHFRDAIRSGRIAPGTRLPSLSQLEDSFGLTRFGARQVMDAMRSEGLAQSWHGRGSYVAERNLHYRIAPTTRFSANLHRQGRNGRVEILDRGARKVRGRIAQMLGVAEGTRVPFVLLLGYVDERPAVLGLHRFAPELSGTLFEALERSGGSISRALAEVGHGGFHRSETLVEARLPTRHEALSLNIPPSQPVMVTTALNLSAVDDRRLEVSCAVARADLISFEVPSAG